MTFFGNPMCSVWRSNWDSLSCICLYVDKCNMVRYGEISDYISTHNWWASQHATPLVLPLHLMIKQYCYALGWFFFSNLLMPLCWKIQQYINTILALKLNSLIFLWSGIMTRNVNQISLMILCIMKSKVNTLCVYLLCIKI